MKKVLCLVIAIITLSSILPVHAQNTEETMARNDGSGTVIAILDRAFDLTHESFVMTAPDIAVTKEKSDTLLPDTFAGKNESTPETLYVSAKIPFAYDYGDLDADVSHKTLGVSGTNLLSIAAGGSTVSEEGRKNALGIAPEAQVLAMKIHSDTVGNVTAKAMEAAINDAVLLGADVILIGVTSMAGFDTADGTEAVNRAIENAEKHGVIVACAAGSVMPYGSGSIWEKEYEMNLIDTETPDVGAIAWPGYLKTTLAVTGADSNTITADCFTLTDGTVIPYSDSNQRFSTVTNGLTFNKFFDGKMLEYVVINGLGYPEDFAASGDLTGKLALVERGEIAFTEKAKNAAAVGAIGLIIYDNQANTNDTLSMLMDLKDSPIPAVIISSRDGSILKEEADKRITVLAGQTHTVTVRKTPTISENMPFGSTPELYLKPDIAAIGSNVECATVENGYTLINSPRAAAAKVAGMCAVIKARLKEEIPDIMATELMKLTRAVLVNSANQLMYPTGSLYSPRIQGGGEANLEAALGASLVLTSDGSHKIELGELNSPVLTLRVTAHNLSDEPKTCTLDAIVGSDSYDKMSFEELGTESENGAPLYEKLGYAKDAVKYFTEKFTQFKNTRISLADGLYQLNSAAEDYEPYKFTLAPHSRDTFNITVYLDEATYETYKEVFKNGFFTEGYVRLSTEDETAAIPYLGFVGDYSAAPYAEADIYSGKPYIYDSIYLYRHFTSGIDKQIIKILGERQNGENMTYNENELIFSPVYDRKNASVYLNFGLLRSVKDVRVGVYSVDGSLIRDEMLGDLTRTYVSASTGNVTSPQIYIWNGRADDNSAYIYPDGEYTVRISYRADKESHEREFSYTLKLDSTAPTVNSCEFSSVESYTALAVSAADNFGIERISVVDTLGVYATAMTDGYFDTTALTGKYVYVEVYDLASNVTVKRVTNPNYSEEG